MAVLKMKRRGLLEFFAGISWVYFYLERNKVRSWLFHAYKFVKISWYKLQIHNNLHCIALYRTVYHKNANMKGVDLKALLI